MGQKNSLINGTLIPVSLLVEASAKVYIYEENREVSVKFLDNLIESHLDTERYLEEVDEQMFNED